MMPPMKRIIYLLLFLFALACGPSDPLDEIRELHRTGHFSESVARLREIVDEDPARAEASLLLGRALYRTGNSGLAVWPLRKASETPEYAVEAGILLAQAMLESRTGSNALEEIDRVLSLEPDNLHAQILRVEANQATGNHEDALEDIDRVLDHEPGNLLVLVSRVMALISLERIDEAGELHRVTAPVRLDEELGAITYMTARDEDAPALLFESFEGHSGDGDVRIVANMLGASRRRFALALGLDPDGSTVELIPAMRLVSIHRETHAEHGIDALIETGHSDYGLDADWTRTAVEFSEQQATELAHALA